MHKVDLSVVTITKNDVSGLEATLSSVLAQTFNLDSNFELIVIDGQSDDGTADLLRGYASHRKITVVSEPDEGIYDAMNKGANLAKGNVILFLNGGDTFLSQESLENAVSKLALHAVNDWSMAVCKAVISNPLKGTESLIRNFPHNWIKHAFGVNPHCHQAIFFNRQYFDASGGHSKTSSFAGDFDLILRLGLLRKTVNLDVLLTRYLAGGVSEQRKREIPLLLHEIRRTRFEYGQVMTFIDLSFTISLDFYRRTFGRLKGAITNK